MDPGILVGVNDNNHVNIYRFIVKVSRQSIVAVQLIPKTRCYQFQNIHEINLNSGEGNVKAF